MIITIIETVLSTLTMLLIGFTFGDNANWLELFNESPLNKAQVDNLVHSVKYAELVVNNER